MTRAPSIALVGLGEVGTSFADALLDRGIELKVASRESSRSTASAKKIGIELDHDIARAAGTADIVLLTMTGDGLREVVAKIAPVLREHAILANLTAANPPHVIAAADMLGANRPQFVDVAIMGAVSLHGIRTPLLASRGDGNGLRRRDESPGVFSVGTGRLGGRRRIEPEIAPKSFREGARRPCGGIDAGGGSSRTARI